MGASKKKSILNRDDLAKISDACKAISSDAADPHGFVPVRNLLARFDANLFVRPLLVEGMLAKLEPTSASNTNSRRWAVLVDSETYPIDDQKVQEESRELPLPARFRNTVAHELVHSLAFRPSEFGIQMRQRTSGSADQSAIVKEIEEETERFSPLLLVPTGAIKSMLSEKEDAITVDELKSAYLRMGVSRYVFINRLNLIGPTDKTGTRHHPGLKNIAIGLGTWISDNRAIFQGWPLFINFERNIVPEFLHRAVHQKKLSADAVISDRSFAMCGGTNTETTLEMSAGSSANPTAEKMVVKLSIERAERRPGSEFMFGVYRL